MLWEIHSLAWAHFGEPGWGTVVTGALVLVAWVMAHQFNRVRGIWVMSALAGLVMLSSPLDAAGRWMVAAPAGLLAVAGSLALFAIGTATALTKHRWPRTS
jgi:CHASE2 domain-containing sensor protein